MTVLDERDAGSAMVADLERIRPDGMSLNAWAVLARVNRSVWSDIRRHGNPSRRTLEGLLVAAGSSLAEFEALRLGPQRATAVGGVDGAIGDRTAGGWRGAPVPRLPRLDTAPAADWPEVGWTCCTIGSRVPGGEVDRPPSVVGDAAAYAIAAADDALWPRFAEGALLVVAPGLPVAVGQDVLVHLAGPENGAMIKRLVAMDAAQVVLRQFAPDRTLALRLDAVRRMERIVGEAI